MRFELGVPKTVILAFALFASVGLQGASAFASRLEFATGAAYPQATNIFAAQGLVQVSLGRWGGEHDYLEKTQLNLLTPKGERCHLSLERLSLGREIPEIKFSVELYDRYDDIYAASSTPIVADISPRLYIHRIRGGVDVASVVESVQNAGRAMYEGFGFVGYGSRMKLSTSTYAGSRDDLQLSRLANALGGPTALARIIGLCVDVSSNQR